MGYLLPKEQMQSLNIDTVEKAIVFSALCLEIMEQSGLNEPDTEIEIIPIVTRNNSSFSITGTFAINTSQYYESGGLVFNNLSQGERPTITPIDVAIAPLTYPFELITLVRKWNIKPSDSLDPQIPDYPDSFEWFEQYLLYYFFIYWASIGGTYSRDITLDYITEDTETTEDTEGLIEPKKQKISFSLNLPIDFNKWLLGGNYINSVKRVLTTYQVPDFSNYTLTLSLLDNETLLTNPTLLIN